MRASCEPVPGSPKEGTKENPSVSADGLSENSHETGLVITGEAFFDAFRRMTQARDVIDEIVGTWDSFDMGRPETDIESWERSIMARAIRNGDAIHQQCYRLQVINDFPKYFGITYETFEVSLNELKRVYGGA